LTVTAAPPLAVESQGLPGGSLTASGFFFEFPDKIPQLEASTFPDFAKAGKHFFLAEQLPGPLEEFRREFFGAVC
jgi:hypothetical protein